MTQRSAPAPEQVLQTAVAGIGGQPRPGQQQMATAIRDAISDRRHLLVQAGTGTGKSLGYLIPVLLELVSGRLSRAVIATATLALQTQLAERDIPAAMDAVRQATGRQPTTAILKGRPNYACRLRVNGGEPEAQQSLIDPQTVHTGAGRSAPTRPNGSDGSRPGWTEPAADQRRSALGAEVVALREWAQSQYDAGGLADRDDAPPHTERAWQQVSIPARECLGAADCPFGDSCFVERSRDQARETDLVITNHALLAIDAMNQQSVLPDHELLIIDEAHELESRVTGAASAELAPAAIQRAAKRASPYLEGDTAGELQSAAEQLRDCVDRCAPGRVTHAEGELIAAVAAVRDAARQLISALSDGERGSRGERSQVSGAAEEIFDVADRVARNDDADVVWVAGTELLDRDIRVAPLTVAATLRERMLTERRVIMTSATCTIGGDFDRLAASVGLYDTDRIGQPGGPEAAGDPAVLGPGSSAADTGPGREHSEPVEETRRIWWSGLDVGSPFDYRRQGMLYIAAHLPKPGRDGLSEPMMAEMTELVSAAGGRTLGLFSSRRAAETATGHLRAALPNMAVLCQGELQLGELTRRFIDSEQTCLFGTLSLWQGLDVPGQTCQQVIIDRIPFPRPDEPLTAARQEAVHEAGGNGFMAVAATHAALLLAQGSGRLIRTCADRGVVAVLDSRLATAGYAGFLRAGMPDMWPTMRRDTVLGSLRRLSGRAPA